MDENLFSAAGIADPINLEEYMSILESLLFAAGDAVKRKDLQQILKLTEEDLEKVLDAYEKALTDKGRGLRLLRLEHRVQLGTKDQHAPYLKALLGVNDRQSLSKGSLECLAIIAFKQPVTRVEVDEIRGVNSDYVLQKLQEKGLIKAVGRKDAPGRPKLYGTTDDFLIQFGFTSLKEMKAEHVLPEKFVVMDVQKKSLEKEDLELYEEE